MNALQNPGQNTHLGYWLGHALRRFDARVLALMAADEQVPLALSNLARRDQIGAAHVHITRHLPRSGARLTALAKSAGMSKQAMHKLVLQCEAWGIVMRGADELDARASQIQFTATGLAWLSGFERATAQAEAEFTAEVGDAVATVVKLGLEVYAGSYDARDRGNAKSTKRARKGHEKR